MEYLVRSNESNKMFIAKKLNLMMLEDIKTGEEYTVANDARCNTNYLLQKLGSKRMFNATISLVSDLSNFKSEVCK